MQTTVRESMLPAFEGLVADQRPHDIITRRAAANLKFGYGVVQTAAIGDVNVPAATGFVFEGVTLHTHNVEPVAGVRQYYEKDPVPVLRKGVIWVLAEVAISVGDPVYLRHTAGGAGQVPGRFRNTADTAKADQITQARWLSETTGTDQLAMLEINLV